MSIIGFNLNKIVVERKKATEGKINISNNVSITNVKDLPLSLGGVAQSTLKIEFRFASKYEPDAGEILFEGDLLWLVEGGKAEDLVKSWVKTRTLPDHIMRTALNHILTKCNIEALLLSRDVNLPPPIPLPKIDRTPEQKKTEEKPVKDEKKQK